MSLVGTRPPTVDEWDKYELHHRARLATKPGLTGMWQVSGRSNITDFEEVVKLDKQYISEWTMGLDAPEKADQFCMAGFILKNASTGDGILTSLKMMEVMMAKKKKLSQLTEDLHIYPQVLVNVMVKDKAVAQADADVQAAISKVAERLGDTGRILVRESGTEPLIRVMVEAETKEICHTYVDEVVSIINKKEATR